MHRALPLGSVVTIKGRSRWLWGPLRQAPLTRALPCKTRVAAKSLPVILATNVGLQLRDQAEVTGQLQESFGLLILVPIRPRQCEA